MKMRKLSALCSVVLAIAIMLTPTFCLSANAEEPSTEVGSLTVTKDSGSTIEGPSASGTYTITLKTSQGANPSSFVNQYFYGDVYFDGKPQTVKFKYVSDTRFVAYDVPHGEFTQMAIAPDEVFTTQDGTKSVQMTIGYGMHYTTYWLRHTLEYLENTSSTYAYNNFNIFSSAFNSELTKNDRYEALIYVDGAEQKLTFTPIVDTMRLYTSSIANTTSTINVPAKTVFFNNQRGAGNMYMTKNAISLTNVNGTFMPTVSRIWDTDGLHSNTSASAVWINGSNPQDYADGYMSYKGTVICDGVNVSNLTIQTYKVNAQRLHLIIQGITATQTLSIPQGTVFTGTKDGVYYTLTVTNDIEYEFRDNTWKIPATKLPVTSVIGINSSSHQLQFASDSTVAGWYNGKVTIDDVETTVRFHLAQNGCVIGQNGVNDAFINAIVSNDASIVINKDTMLTLVAGEGDNHPNEVLVQFPNTLYVYYSNGNWEVSESNPQFNINCNYVNIASSNQMQFTTDNNTDNYGWYEGYVDIEGVSTKIRVSMGTAGSMWCTFGQNGLTPEDAFLTAIKEGSTIHVPRVVSVTAIQGQENSNLTLDFGHEFWLYMENDVMTKSDIKPATVVNAVYGDIPASNQVRFFYSGDYSGFWCKGTANVNGVDEDVNFYLSKNWGVVGNNDDAVMTAIIEKKPIKLYRNTEIVSTADSNDRYILKFDSDVYLTYINGTEEWAMTSSPVSQIIDITTIIGNLTDVSTVATGSEYVLPSLPQGYSGWKIGNNYYDAGESIKVTGDLTLKAYTLLLGDVNDDAYVNIVDLISLKKYMAGIGNTINMINACCSETSDDVESADLTSLVNIILTDTVTEYVLPSGDASVKMDLAAYSGPRRGGYRYYEGVYGDHPDDPDGGYSSHITSADFDEYMEAGFTYLITENDAYYDYDPTTDTWINDYSQMTNSLKTYLDLAESKNIPVLVSSQIINRMLKGTTLVSNAQLQKVKTMTTVLSAYDCFKGYLASDELSIIARSSETGNVDINIADVYSSISDAVKAVNSEAILYTSELPLYGFDSTDDYINYIDTFADAAGSFVYDFYPLIATQKSFISGGGTTTAIRENWFTNLNLVAKSAKTNDYDAGIVVQAFADTNAEKTSSFFQSATYLRTPNSYGDIGFQVYTALAYGMKSISYYKYMQSWSESDTSECVASMVRYADENDPDSPIEKTPIYDAVKKVNNEIKTFDHILMQYDWQGTMAVKPNNVSASALLNEVEKYTSTRISSVTATAETVVGCLADNSGNDAFVVANATNPYSNTSSAVHLTFNDAKLAVIYQNGVKRIVRLIGGNCDITLTSGQGAVIIPIN